MLMLSTTYNIYVKLMHTNHYIGHTHHKCIHKINVTAFWPLWGKLLFLVHEHKNRKYSVMNKSENSHWLFSRKIYSYFVTNILSSHLHFTLEKTTFVIFWDIRSQNKINFIQKYGELYSYHIEENFFFYGK